jgi:hypothetical protein
MAVPPAYRQEMWNESKLLQAREILYSIETKGPSKVYLINSTRSNKPEEESITCMTYYHRRLE